MTSIVDSGGGLAALPLLRGQKATGTGANSGIGLATAIALNRAGADVVVNYVAGQDAAEDVVRQIQAFGVRAFAQEADVSDKGRFVGMFARSATWTSAARPTSRGAGPS